MLTVGHRVPNFFAVLAALGLLAAACGVSHPGVSHPAVGHRVTGTASGASNSVVTVPPSNCHYGETCPELPAFHVTWAGQIGNGAQQLTSTDHPVALLSFANLSGAPETVNYDLIIVTQRPAQVVVGQTVLSPETLQNVVWDWRQAHPSEAGSVAVAPGATVTVDVDWPFTTSAGTSVATGLYFAYLPLLVNGANYGYSEANLQFTS